MSTWSIRHALYSANQATQDSLLLVWTSMVLWSEFCCTGHVLSDL